MSALRAWRCQSERTFNSGATINSDDSLPPGTCDGLVSMPPVSSIAGKSVKAPARKPIGANGSRSVAGALRRVGVAMVGTKACACGCACAWACACGGKAAPRRAGSGAGRIGTAGAAAVPAAACPGDGEAPGLGLGTLRVLRRVLVESKPVLPAPIAGGLP